MKAQNILTSFDLADAQRHPVDYLGLSALWMIPVAFVAGQWLAWRGYHRKKNNLIVLGMSLSSSPIAVFLIYLTMDKVTGH